MGFRSPREERRVALRAATRADVRGTARGYRSLRRFGVSVGVCLLLGAVALHVGQGQPVGVIVLYTGVAAAGLLAIGALLRRLLRSFLEARLAKLPQDQRIAALLPLREDANPETRRVAESLIKRYCALQSEVTPAAPAGGRGSEPAADARRGDAPEVPPVG